MILKKRGRKREFPGNFLTELRKFYEFLFVTAGLEVKISSMSVRNSMEIFD
jgi:hypothetical protein